RHLLSRANAYRLIHTDTMRALERHSGSLACSHADFPITADINRLVRSDLLGAIDPDRDRLVVPDAFGAVISHRGFLIVPDLFRAVVTDSLGRIVLHHVVLILLRMNIDLL